MSKISQESIAVIALGSNLRGPYASCVALLDAALERFARLGLTVTKRSDWWRSAAWPQGSGPDYLNGVALVETSLQPQRVMTALLSLELEFGRRRGEPHAPRTLDLDLIALGSRVIDDRFLTLPHPRAAERRFVMGPLAQIAPGWRHPVTGDTALVLARRAQVGVDAAPMGAGAACIAPD